MRGDGGGNTLTGLLLVPEKNRLAGWLRDMARQRLLGEEDYNAALRHFRLFPDEEGRRIFVERVFALLGAILLVCGVIFLVAWNWEDLPRQGKLALGELLFIAFSSWSIWRWDKKNGWDSRPALFGAALLLGALLALYGQIYQTGADAWELFRAWSLALFPLALAGRATAFWLLLWIVGDLAFSLYLLELGGRENLLDLGLNFPLELALGQFLFWLSGEAAHALSAGRAYSFDPRRLLCRAMGCAAICALTLHFVLLVWNSEYFHYYASPAGNNLLLPPTWGFPVHILCLAAILYCYYKILPDSFILSLAVFSAAGATGAVLLQELWSRPGHYPDEGVLLLSGLIILGLCLGAVRLALFLRGGILKEARLRAEKSGREGEGVFSEAAALRAETGQSRELASWLEERGAADPAAVENFFQAVEQARNEHVPWLSRIFATLGIWLGSAAVLGFLSVISYQAGMDMFAYGLCGLILCAASVLLGRSGSFTRLQLGRVVGLCGLAYAGALTDFDLRHTLLLLALLCGLFWFFRAHPAERLSAFIGLLACFCAFLNFTPGWMYSGMDLGEGGRFGSVYDVLFCAGLLFALREFGLGPFSGKEAGSALLPALRRSAALGSLIYFSAVLLAAHSLEQAEKFFGGGYRLTLPLTLLAVGAVLWRRLPGDRALILFSGALLLPAAYLMPAVSWGISLLFLARAGGRSVFLGLAAFYLGLANFWYYYNLSLSLRDKGLLLLGIGCGLILVSASLRLYSKRFPPFRGEAHA